MSFRDISIIAAFSPPMANGHCRVLMPLMPLGDDELDADVISFLKA